MDSPQKISAVHRHWEAASTSAAAEAAEEREVLSDDDDDFEFAFVPRDHDPDAATAAADVYSPAAYPVFGRGLASSSSECDELEQRPPAEGSYCDWAPRSAPQSPSRCRKSSSVGSEERRWRLLDLLTGRSRSDGRERFVYMSSPERPVGGERTAKAKAAEGKKKEGRKGGKVTEMDVVTAHRDYYGNGAKGGRRSFLPYRPELVGFFPRR